MDLYSFTMSVIALDLVLLAFLVTIAYGGCEADKYVADQQKAQQEQEEEEAQQDQDEDEDEDEDQEEEDENDQQEQEQEDEHQDAVSMQLASSFERLLQSAERHKAQEEDAVSMQLASSFVRLLESAERHKEEAERHNSQLPISEIQADDVAFDEFREGWAESWGVAPYKLHPTSPAYPIGTWLRFFNDYGNQGVVVTNGMFLIRSADGCPAYKTVKLDDWLIMAQSVGRGAISISPDGALPPVYNHIEPTDDQAKKDKELQERFAEVCSKACSDCDCSQPPQEANLTRSPTATDLDVPRDYTLPYGDGTVRGVYD